MYSPRVPDSTHQQRNRSPRILTIVLLAGLAVRLWGIRVGLKQTFYVDEYAYLGGAFMVARLLFPGQTVHFGSWNPLGWQVILALVYGAYYVLGQVAGWFPSVAAFRVYHWQEPQVFFLIGRVAAAIVSTLTIPLACDIARRLFGRRAGLLAAALIAFSYPLVWFSHNCSNINFVAFLAALVLWAALVVREGRAWWAYLLCGAAVGYGIGTKYYPGALVLPVLIAHWTSDRLERRPWPARLLDLGLWAAGVAALVAAVVANPIFAIAPDKIIYNLQYQSNWLIGGSPLYNLAQMLFGRFAYWYQVAAEPIPVFYATSLRAMGDLALGVALVAAIWGAIRHRWSALFLLIAPLVMAIVSAVSGGVGVGIRQLFFAIPSLAILSGALLDAWLRARGRAWRIAGLLITVALIGVQVANVVRMDLVHTRPTTTEIARRWLLEHVPPGTIVAVEPHYGPFVETLAAEEDLKTFQAGDVDAQSTISAIRAARRPPFSVVLAQEEDKPPSLEQLRENGVCLFVSADYMSVRYTAEWRSFLGMPPDEPRTEAYRAFYESVDAQAELVASISPRQVRAAGPLFKVYRVSDAPECALAFR